MSISLKEKKHIAGKKKIYQLYQEMDNGTVSRCKPEAVLSHWVVHH